MTGFEDQNRKTIVKQNLDQYTRFLKPTIVEKFIDFFDNISPIIGKELSCGNIEREDMMSFLEVRKGILVLLQEGQINLALKWMVDFEGELKLTMSIDAKFIEQIGQNKFEYTQEQHVYEHTMQEQEKKRGGFFGLLKGR